VELDGNSQGYAKRGGKIAFAGRIVVRVSFAAHADGGLLYETVFLLVAGILMRFLVPASVRRCWMKRDSVQPFPKSGSLTATVAGCVADGIKVILGAQD
jgi:hypothetical protein